MLWLILPGVAVCWLYFYFSRKQLQITVSFVEEEKEIEKHYWDPVSDRCFSKNQIRSQLPYTKKKHFWLVDREDLRNGNKIKNSIEIVHDSTNEILKIRYWNQNRIDGIEVCFDRKNLIAKVSYYDFGEQLDVEDEEAKGLIIYARDLYKYYCESSPYVKNLDYEDWFDIEY